MWRLGACAGVALWLPPHVALDGDAIVAVLTGNHCTGKAGRYVCSTCSDGRRAPEGSALVPTQDAQARVRQCRGTLKLNQPPSAERQSVAEVGGRMSLAGSVGFPAQSFVECPGALIRLENPQGRCVRAALAKVAQRRGE